MIFNPNLRTILIPFFCVFFLYCSEDDQINNSDEPGENINWVFVEGGTFQMGDRTGGGDTDQRPVHMVTLNDFYISKYEITFLQYENYCRKYGIDIPDDMNWGGGNRPVILVSWDDAKRFCDSIGARLPSEAEWEYAARGGKLTKNYIYSGSDNFEDVAWCNGYSNGITEPVGNKQPNELGLYDMSGNVWEWCSDWYGRYSSAPQNNPTGPDSGDVKVLRGGSYNYYPSHSTVAYRSYGLPFDKTAFFGFRPVKSVDKLK